MNKKLFLISNILLFIAEIITLIIFAVQPTNFSQDAVKVNEIVQSVTEDFNYINEHSNSTSLDYVVLDNKGNLLFRTKSGITESVSLAITHRDTILDIEINGEVVGKIIIYNDCTQILESQKKTTILILIMAILFQCVIFIGYYIYINLNFVKPFKKLKGFAERIAGGNLDIPLEMDRHNIFGEFTESFDIMRAELKKARLAEAKANESKKELVAKLSHDIKTPVASIKAVSEVGFAISNNSKDKANYTQIIAKADQINNLVTNLFNATLEELKELSVIPTTISTKQVKTILLNADYLHRAIIPDLPECLVQIDPLRLQQVFDNIFANSYKYADTEILVSVQNNDNQICIIIEDFGGGVNQEELPILKEKFKRGSNAINTEGAGLGLYISDYFMREMNGELKILNGLNGLKVMVSIALCGKN